MATVIYCAAIDCKYHNDKGKCTAKTIDLNWCSVQTVYEGRQEYNKCKMYELSPEAREIYDKIKQYLDEKGITSKKEKE